MRQLAAVAILVGLISAPALRIWCETSCGSDRTPAPVASASSHCHEVAAAPDAPVGTPRFTSNDECATHALDAAAVVSNQDHRLQGLSIVAVVDASGHSSQSDGHDRWRSSRNLAPSPPSLRSSRILRI